MNFPSNSVNVTPHTVESQGPQKQITYVTWCYYLLIRSAFTKVLIFFQGWYEAEVQSFDYDDDEIELIFSDEPGYVYSIPALPSLISGTLRLKKQLF